MSEMGAGEMGPSTKTTKTSTPQEQPPPVSTPPPPYSEWAAALQAFYSSGTAPMPPPGYFPPSVGSGPQPHPYMWGAQHLMAPYGTPPPYAAMYTHGGIYGHTTMAPGTHPFSPYPLPSGSTVDTQANSTPVNADGEVKSGEGKVRSSMKRSKGSLGSLGALTAGKGTDAGKGNNGTYSNSNDSGSEGSTEGSEGTSPNGSDGGHKNGDQVANSVPYGSGQEGNAAVPALPLSIAGKQVMGAGPLTNLNIGMDYWNGGAPAVLANSGGGKRGVAPGSASAMVPSGVGAGDVWLQQDERELKRQRRKQSNRESARRSRLRKQAECEELAGKVHTLESENGSLRSELARVHDQCNKLAAENRSLMEQMQKTRGAQPEPMAEMEPERKGKGHKRGERCDAGSLPDNEHSHRDGRVTNDAFSVVAKEGGNLAVSVTTG